MWKCLFLSFLLKKERVRSAAGRSSEQEKPRTPPSSSSSSSTGFTLGRPQVPDTGRAPEEDGPHSLGQQTSVLIRGFEVHFEPLK